MSDPVTYRTTISLPDLVASFFERITEVGWIIQINGDAHEVEVQFEQESADEYQLAETVHDLRAALSSIGFFDSIQIQRPRRIENKR